MTLCLGRFDGLRCTRRYWKIGANNETPSVGCSNMRFRPFRHVPIRNISHHAPRQSHFSGAGTQQSRDSYKAIPFLPHLTHYSSAPSISFLPLSYSTTSSSTAYSACFTYRTQRAILLMVGETLSIGKFLLGPGWVLNSAPLYVLIR